MLLNKTSDTGYPKLKKIMIFKNFFKSRKWRRIKGRIKGRTKGRTKGRLFVFQFGISFCTDFCAYFYKSLWTYFYTYFCTYFYTSFCTYNYTCAFSSWRNLIFGVFSNFENVPDLTVFIFIYLLDLYINTLYTFFIYAWKSQLKIMK